MFLVGVAHNQQFYDSLASISVNLILYVTHSTLYTTPQTSLDLLGVLSSE